VFSVLVGSRVGNGDGDWDGVGARSGSGGGNNDGDGDGIGESCEMSILLHGAKASNQILPEEKRKNQDNFGT